MSEQEKKYGTKWLKFQEVPIGGSWFWRIGIIQETEDDVLKGAPKIRLAKCRKSKEKGFVQMQKVNFKTQAEYDKVDIVLRQFLKELESSKPSIIEVTKSQPVQKKPLVDPQGPVSMNYEALEKCDQCGDFVKSGEMAVHRFKHDRERLEEEV